MKLEDKNLVYLKSLQKKKMTEDHDKEIKKNPHEHWWYLRTDNTAYLRSTHPFSIAADFFKAIAPKTVLNLGDSRGGAESVYFKNLGWKSLSCDHVTSVLKIAKEETHFIDDYIEQDAEEMTLESESFDYVITKETLHHLYRPYSAIYEMLRVAKEGICIIEPRDYYDFGKEKYEPCGNFIFGFSLKELAKTFIAMNYPEICYRYIWETQPVIDAYGQCGGEKFLQNKDQIQAKINEWYISHDKDDGQLLMIFCFKKKCPNRNILEKCGFEFPNIIRNSYILEENEEETKKKMTEIERKEKKMEIQIYNDTIPLYLWPNQNFPFMIYLLHEKCRIFMIENIQHNYEWLEACRNFFKETDYFFVKVGCYTDEQQVLINSEIIENLHLKKENFIIMFNDSRDEYLFRKYEFDGEIINNNAWLDESLFHIIDSKKIYDAILVGRAIKIKRLYLANKVKNLALLTGTRRYEDETVILPPHINKNDRMLKVPEMVKIINESKCGLCLSIEEGACYASSECLLCGLPVVSTMSEGGRNIWYNKDNAIICQPNEDMVASAVEEIISLNLDPFKIRNQHIELSKMFRRKFIQRVDDILKKCGVTNIDSGNYFRRQFTHKMINYLYRVDEVIKSFRSNVFYRREEKTEKAENTLENKEHKVFKPNMIFQNYVRSSWGSNIKMIEGRIPISQFFKSREIWALEICPQQESQQESQRYTFAIPVNKNWDVEVFKESVSLFFKIYTENKINIMVAFENSLQKTILPVSVIIDGFNRDKDKNGGWSEIEVYVPINDIKTVFFSGSINTPAYFIKDIMFARPIASLIC